MKNIFYSKRKIGHLPRLLMFLSLAIFAVIGSSGFAHSEPSSLRVAFSVEHESGLQMVDTRTGEVSPIDVGMMNIGKLAYSHKRNILVFEGAKEHGEPRAIYAYDFNTKSVERLYNPSSFGDILFRPSFHPNGNLLFALNYSSGFSQYSFISEQWEKVKVENTNEVTFQGISISRSGKKVAISPSKFKGFLIGALDNNKITINRTILAEFSCISPRWIGDNVIVFAGRKTKGKQYLWKVTLDTGVVEQLTKEPLGTRDFLDVSIDEDTVVFTATDSSYEWRLWTIALNSDVLNPLTRTGHGHLSPVWID